MVAKGTIVMVPQGGVPSPVTVIDRIVNDLIANINKTLFYTVGDADDIAVLTTGNYTSTLSDITQAAQRIRKDGLQLTNFR